MSKFRRLAYFLFKNSWEMRHHLNSLIGMVKLEIIFFQQQEVKMGRRFGWHSGNVNCRDITSSGKQVVKHVAVSSNYTVKDEDFLIGVDTSSSAVTVTIPTALLEKGRLVIINDEGGNAATNNITIATGGSETIDGSATATISTNNATLALYSDGSNWYSY